MVKFVQNILKSLRNCFKLYLWKVTILFGLIKVDKGNLWYEYGFPKEGKLKD